MFKDFAALMNAVNHEKIVEVNNCDDQYLMQILSLNDCTLRDVQVQLPTCKSDYVIKIADAL